MLNRNRTAGGLSGSGERYGGTERNAHSRTTDEVVHRRRFFFSRCGRSVFRWARREPARRREPTRRHRRRQAASSPGAMCTRVPMGPAGTRAADGTQHAKSAGLLKKPCRRDDTGRWRGVMRRAFRITGNCDASDGSPEGRSFQARLVGLRTGRSERTTPATRVPGESGQRGASLQKSLGLRLLPHIAGRCNMAFCFCGWVFSMELIIAAPKTGPYTYVKKKHHRKAYYDCYTEPPTIRQLNISSSQ